MDDVLLLLIAEEMLRLNNYLTLQLGVVPIQKLPILGFPTFACDIPIGQRQRQWWKHWHLYWHWQVLSEFGIRIGILAIYDINSCGMNKKCQSCQTYKFSVKVTKFNQIFLLLRCLLDQNSYKQFNTADSVWKSANLKEGEYSIEYIDLPCCHYCKVTIWLRRACNQRCLAWGKFACAIILKTFSFELGFFT